MPASSPAPENDLMPVYVWASLRTDLLWAYEGVVPAGNHRKDQDHTRGYWVWLLRKGTVKTRMGSQTWRARAGEWMVAPQGFMSQEFSDDAEILSIHFNCQWPTGHNLFAGDAAEVFAAGDYPALEKTATAVRKLIDRHFPGIRTNLSHATLSHADFLRFDGTFMRWMDAFGATMRARGREVAFPATEGDSRLFHVARRLNEASLAEPFPIEELARGAGLGRAHLDRLFFKAFGRTTHAFWESRRTEAARAALAHSAVSVKELGFRLGFKQASHFTKWFGQHFGKSPEKWRAGESTPPPGRRSGKRGAATRAPAKT